MRLLAIDPEEIWAGLIQTLPELAGDTLPCPYCNGEGGRVRYTPGSMMPDPQTEELCPRCEGSGVEGLL